MLRIYLAGPFFNPESRKVLGLMLEVLEKAEHDVWAPMRDGILCPKNAPDAMRRKVFNLDCAQIQWADCIVALLDYPLPLHQRLLLQCRTPEGRIENVKDISFPDSGTIFEMGYGMAFNKHIIGLTTHVGGFNLMLSEACICIVHDLEALQKAIALLLVEDFDGLYLMKKVCQKMLEEL